MVKEKDRMIVECDVIYLNDTKPEKWEQTFEWKPTVSFYYFEVDENFQKVGELQKTWIKNDLWLFQAMGGKNGKGHFFDIMITRGEYKGKPTASVMPVAEMFPDGSARMIKPPKDGKVSVPATTKPPTTTVTSKTIPPTTKPPVATKPAEPRPGVPLPVKPKPKPGEKFIEFCFTPSTNQFFRMQDGFAEDGYILTQSQNLAMEATRQQLTLRHHQEQGRSEYSEPLLSGDEFKAEFDMWQKHFECKLSHLRWIKTRDRIYSILLNCLTIDQVTACVEMGWSKLPKSYYEMVRTKARERLEEINAAEKTKNPLKPSLATATPEVCEQEPEEEPEIENDVPVEETPVEPPPPPPKPEIELAVVNYACNAIIKAQTLKVLMSLWETTRPELKEHPMVIKSMWLWIDAQFSVAQYQTDVDEIGKTFPVDILTEEQRASLDARYAKLLTF